MTGEEKSAEWYGEQMQTKTYLCDAKYTSYYHMWLWALEHLIEWPTEEIACGTGQFAKLAMEKKVWYKRGVDFAHKNIETAGVLTGHPELFKVMDVLDGYKPPSKHHTVVAFEFLEHIRHPQQILELLKDNRVIYSLPSYGAPTHLHTFSNMRSYMGMLLRYHDIRHLATFEQGKGSSPIRERRWVTCFVGEPWSWQGEGVGR